MRQSELYIGMMSGTSLDGVDAVLVDFSLPLLTHGVKVMARASLIMPEALRDELLALHEPGYNELHRAQCVSLELGRLYVALIEKLLDSAPGYPRSMIRAAGIHGQTIRHCPESGYTLQLNAPAWIAEHASLNVVSDFRSIDIAAGGQGAPLVPAFHAALLGCSDTHPNVVLNIGGISNISVLQAGALRGWDCGPGNILMDAWYRKYQSGTFDQEGQWAKAGVCIPSLLDAFLKDPYFSQSPPKSTGRDYFNLAWLASYLSQYAVNANPEDVQATLLHLTAEAIVRDCVAISPTVVWVAGGGVYNSALLDRIRVLFKYYGCEASVESIEAMGVYPLDLEAIAFAWLARQYMLEQPGNEPLVTGAKGFRRLGSLTPYTV
jgi:anhydro-N-acetylmuramic acid kinase